MNICRNVLARVSKPKKTPSRAAELEPMSLKVGIEAIRYGVAETLE